MFRSMERMGTATAQPTTPVGVAACCSPLTGGVLDEESAQQLARVFKALGDPTRVRLVSLIAAADGAEACLCDLTDPVGLSQPTVSHHLKKLSDAGLLEKTRSGRTVTHAVRPELFAELRTVLQMD